MELKKAALYLSFPTMILIVVGFKTTNTLDTKKSLSRLLTELGEDRPSHYIENLDPDLVQSGKELIHNGKTKGSRYISKYFVCTSCHNTVKESDNLMDEDPDARLNYAETNNVAYLQASTFYGIVNRESWYNDDYVKKYGELVVKANRSLEESIQLCATVCSAGRRLNDDEMKAILAYFWSIELKLSDLNLSNEELSIIEKGLENEKSRKGAIDLLKSKYPLKSPATFVDAPEDKEKGYGLVGRADMGRKVFDLSCKKCHRPHGESDVVFEDSKKTYKWFVNNIGKDKRLSIYNIIRYGTYSEKGHPEYMPHYTAEKMSNQQVEDLRSFLISMASSN